MNNRVSPNQLSDEILIARVSQGDNAALETLYDRHAALVLGLSLQIVGERASAEDILQEVFWQVWQNATAYQSQRGSFTSWLVGMARKLAIDANRNTTQVRNVLRCIPHEQRQVIEMAYFYGMTRQEIADATGNPLDTISSLARSGLQKLNEALEHHDEIE